MIFKNYVIVGSSLSFGRTTLKSQENASNLIFPQPAGPLAGCCLLITLVLWLSLPCDIVPVGAGCNFL